MLPESAKGQSISKLQRSDKFQKKLTAEKTWKPQINTVIEAKASSQTQAWAELTTVDEKHKVIDLKFGCMGGTWGRQRTS